MFFFCFSDGVPVYCHRFHQQFHLDNMANQQQFPKLVNKQFNSPINLYSESNVKEILERETQLLSNGAVG